MVDATQASESRFINAELIENSPTKVLVPITAGEYVKGNYGMKLELGVELDGKEKIYSPNQASAEAIIVAYGKDTKSWLGKKIKMEVIDGKVYATGKAE